MGMRSLTSFKKGLAVLLLFVAGAVAYPSLTGAGGADDPGYTGGGSHPHGQHATLSPVPAPGLRHPHGVGVRQRENPMLQPLRAWLLTILGGFLR
jgi:hypothetical protein